ncbi:cytochrome b/b6 domain-containing protein [Gynuella sunshinyii]|uniref:Thiosulfate reductase cytochrome B subunit (Membrane anchoring protein) n=1 Tax=Gynuella sunshinyii YC6258 TaxID=1445510 RepID=A0A0C5VEK1_9GAMM|nr:cytochrome b/b6 domain-containing protein [Gynuella sunshinyii]AJQ92987.1 thiosulfate reductase cytochrome B subunit (membrane anchoring protein) [Gynuella sunshinyii YC6258]
MRSIVVIMGMLLGTLSLANTFHPDIPLLNGEGKPWQAGEAVSQAQSCGQCHDQSFIHHTMDQPHILKMTEQQRFAWRLGIQPELPERTESQCLLCHAPEQKQLTVLADPQGVVNAADLSLGSPTSEACGRCHSAVQTDVSRPFVLPELNLDNHAAFTGEMYVAQRISRSAINIADKQVLNFSFDIHAERVLSCADCHAAANNPTAPQGLSADSKTVKYDPRGLSAHDFLRQPDHGFTAALPCSECHDAGQSHQWLPYQDQHFSRLSCESCHSSWIAGPALAAVNLDTDPAELQWRGITEELVTGYQAWLLPDEQGRLAPFNLIAVTENGATRTIAKAIHHNVNTQTAVRACQDCHSDQSKLLQPITQAPVNLTLPAGFVVADGLPDLTAAGIYLLGSNAVPMADWLGLALLVATVAGVFAHGMGRYLAWRRLGAHREPRRRVYMYSRYERLWHWLQAAAILLLLITGAVIHKPYLFAWISFPYMVQIHNVLGFILLVNAVLALFYHLASGEIRQFIPMPADLFVRMFEQIRFYTSGIFKGAPHPFEKTPEQKLNPLQKIAYFGLLNALLPAQMLTGLLIWGAQRWPELAMTFGGLVWLGPVHTFLAWAFVAFLVMHIYLTTTSGPKLTSGIKAMVEGWEEVEVTEEHTS